MKKILIKLKDGLIESIFPLLLMLLTVVLTLLLLGFDIRCLPQQLALSRKVCSIYSKLNSEYLYDDDLDSISDAAANGIMSSLDDDYGFYYNPEDFVAKKAELDSESKGIGISFSQNPDTKKMTVIEVNSNGPAKDAGIKKGDILEKINGKSLDGLKLSEVYELVQAKEGEKITVSVVRNSKPIDITVTPGDYITDTVYYHIIKNIGYVQITDFNNTTAEQFETAVKELQKQKVSGLIFDLRNNGGGTVDSCEKILDLLLPKGNTVVIRVKDKSTKVLYKSDENEINLPMAVLVNDMTASASEIFSMNIRDYNKGKLIGTKTFGKGIMQTTFGLRDGTAVKFTTAEVIDKNGETYHKKGLEPDIEVKLSDYQQSHFYFLTDDTDPQICAAVTYIQSKIKK